jgi:pilus assembly protein CpaF
VPLSMAEREQVLSDVLDEVFGLGPLEPLLRDPSVNDILVNTYKQVYVERSGMLEKVPASFQDDKHLMRVIDRIVSAWAGAWTTARRWWTRGSPTARA